jgi:predicted transcriptional regulator
MREIAEAYGVARFSLVKLDIEGAEFEVLNDENSALLDRLVMEIHEEVGSVQKLVKRLLEAGLQVRMISGKGPYLFQSYLYARCANIIS